MDKVKRFFISKGQLIAELENGTFMRQVFTNGIYWDKVSSEELFKAIVA